MASAAAMADGSGVYLSGQMNDWATEDPAWELTLDADYPGWATIDLTSMPANTEFCITGFGRTYKMKNAARVTINRNSMHYAVPNGSYNLTACQASLDGVHLMVQVRDFKTTTMLPLLTITDESIPVYGACMKNSIEPVPLSADEANPAVVKGEVEITEGFYFIKAYKLSNITQTVVSYGLSDTEGVLQPTDFESPTASPVPVPAKGVGKYPVTFNTETYAYTIGEDTGVGSIGSEAIDAVYYNLQGIRVDHPVKGNVYIRFADGRPAKILL